MSGKKANDGARALSGKEKKEFDNVVRCYETKQHKKGLKSADFVLKKFCLLYTSPSPRDQRGSRMPSSA